MQADLTGLVVNQNLTVHDLESKISVYTASTAESGTSLARSFCSACGSSLFVANNALPNQVAVTSGSMDNVQGGHDADNDKMWKPKLEFFCKRKATWLATEGTVQRDSM
ncbi:hypothetical protein CTA2_3511 [Colletotrichum tanaceti]|nr:hypothetical protein CTA2_3511 [Colletotrichum tanaceti]